MTKRLDTSFAFTTDVGTTILTPGKPPVFLEGEAEQEYWKAFDGPEDETVE